MEIQLLKRWGSRLPHQVCNVSEERAKALSEEGIAKIIGVIEEKPTKNPGKPKPGVDKQ